MDCGDVLVDCADKRKLFIQSLRSPFCKLQQSVHEFQEEIEHRVLIVVATITTDSVIHLRGQLPMTPHETRDARRPGSGRPSTCDQQRSDARLAERTDPPGAAPGAQQPPDARSPPTFRRALLYKCQVLCVQSLLWESASRTRHVRQRRRRRVEPTIVETAGCTVDAPR
jgi:hypothetical protein